MNFNFLFARLAAVSLATTMLAACGGGDNGYCVVSFKDGSSSAGNVCQQGCEITSDRDSNDDDASSYTKIVFGPGGGTAMVKVTGPDSMEQIPSTDSAGALMRFPAKAFQNVGVTFNFYNRNGLSVGTASGGASRTNGQMDGAGRDTYYGNASSAVPFNSVEAVVTLSGNTEPEEVRIYEICGAK